MRILLLSLLFFSQNLIAQTPFNHRLENGQIQAIGQLVHELESSYLGFGRGIDTIDFLRGVYCTEFDKKTGEVLTTKKVTFPNSLLFFNRGNSVFDIEGKPHFLFHRSDTIYLSSYSELDKQIRTEKKIYSSDSTSSLFIYDFHNKDDEIFILSGHSTGEKDEVLFIYNLQTDSLFEQFLYDEEGNMKDSRMQILKSGDILLTYSIKIGDENKIQIKEIDTDGNSIWKYTNENKREGFVNSFIPMSDSTFILGGVKSRDTPNTTDDDVIPYILKFNYNQRKITGRSDFDIPEDEWYWMNGTVEEIIPSHDGQTFLCISELFDFPLNPDTLQSHGMIAKVDHDLNVIWRRTYAYIDGEYRNHDFEDVIATWDGNYLAYGTSTKTFSFPGEVPILSWAIKIDEDGKIIGDTTTVTIEWENTDLSDEIEIFPNPATDHIYINQNDIDDVQYMVFDFSGRLIEEFILPDRYRSVIKSIESWENGYHFVRLIKDGRSIGSVKVLKI